METAIEVAGPEPMTPAAQTEAEQLDREICADIVWLSGAKEQADHRIARIGGLLWRMSQGELYRALGFPSIHRYMRDRVSRFENLCVSQLYACKEVAEQLTGHVSPAEIEAMGITKAHELAKAKRATGRAPSAELVSKAATEKTEQFKESVAEEFALRADEPRPKGKWYDFGGFFADADDRAVIERALRCACLVDPPIQPTESDVAQRREIFLRFCMEFLATHEESLTPQMPGRVNKGDVI